MSEEIKQAPPPLGAWFIMHTDLSKGLAVFRARFGREPKAIWLWQDKFCFEIWGSDDTNRA